MAGPDRFVVTSVVRRSGQAQASGFVRIVHRESGRVIACAAMPQSAHRTSDPNPRGGLRGARGISVHGDRIVIANTDRLLVHDRQFRPVAEISHPLTAGIHDVLAGADGIWITSTSADLLVHVTWEGAIDHVWEWRRDDALVRALGFGSVPAVDRDVDLRDPRTAHTAVRNIVHLNSVARGSNGLLLSLGRVLAPRRLRQRHVGAKLRKLADRAIPRRPAPPAPLIEGGANVPIDVSGTADSSSAIVQLDEQAGSASILHRVADTSVPNHNAIEHRGQLLFCDSNASEIVAVGGSDGPVRVAIPGDRPFVRGLAAIDSTTIICGSQLPASVHEIDSVHRRITRTYDLGGESTESVYGVCPLPDDFGDGGLFAAALGER